MTVLNLLMWLCWLLRSLILRSLIRVYVIFSSICCLPEQFIGILLIRIMLIFMRNLMVRKLLFLMRCLNRVSLMSGLTLMIWFTLLFFSFLFILFDLLFGLFLHLVNRLSSFLLVLYFSFKFLLWLGSNILGVCSRFSSVWLLVFSIVDR